jgi:hypothetical protein
MKNAPTGTFQTVYTIHSAADHSIYAIALVGTLSETAKKLATEENDGTTKRFYVSNGMGIISAFLTRNGIAHDILVHDYRQFKDRALQVREAHGYWVGK